MILLLTVFAALFASSQLSDALCIALRDLWEIKVQLPFIAILFALVRLGANPSILEGLGLITERVQKNYVSHETRLKALKRLLAIVKTAALSVESLVTVKILTKYVLVPAPSLRMMSQIWC